MNKIKTFLPFLFCCVIAISFGGLFQPGEWYNTINRAPWTPPNVTFGIVWPILYILIAIAGWQLWRAKEMTLVWLWGAQLVLNALWSWLFFGEHWLFISLVDLSLIWVLVAMLITLAWRRGLKAPSLLLMPYLIWLSLAWSLNGYIALYN